MYEKIERAVLKYLDNLGTNYDQATGCHYGTCYVNDFNRDPHKYADDIDWLLDDITTEGHDLHYEAFLLDLRTRLKAAYEAPDEDRWECVSQVIGEVIPFSLMHEAQQTFSDYCEDDFVEWVEMAASERYESYGTKWRLERDGYIIEYDSDDNGLWVIKSPYYTMANHCSPCAPNAGYLTQPGSIKTYCLGPDLLDTPPYPVYNVATDELVNTAQG